MGHRSVSHSVTYWELSYLLLRVLVVALVAAVASLFAMALALVVADGENLEGPRSQKIIVHRSLGHTQH